MVLMGKEGMDGEELCAPGDCSGGLKGADRMDNGELLFRMESGEGRDDSREPGSGDLLSELEDRVELKRSSKGDGDMDCLSSKLKFLI